MRDLNQAIIFDFFGVICSEIAPLWLKKHFEEADAKKIRVSVVHSADLGEITQREMFDRLGCITKVSPVQVEREWWSYVSIDGNVVDVIRKLRTYYTIALLTNSPSPFVREIISRHNLTPLFDFIIVSSEEQCAKPDLAIYELVLERLSTRAQDTLMIDDSPINIKVAIDAGMKGLVFESGIKLQEALSDRRYLLPSND